MKGVFRGRVVCHNCRRRYRSYNKNIERNLRRQLHKKKKEKLTRRQFRSQAIVAESDSEILLSATQSDQLMNAQTAITEHLQSELDSLLDEIEARHSFGARKRLMDAWAADQKRNKDGSTQNRWHPETYRVALALYSRSPAAYKTLAKFPVVQLPSVRQLQRVSSTTTTLSQGVNEIELEKERIKYKQHLKKLGRGPGVGVIVFDDCKLVQKIVMNSKNHDIYGLAVTPDQLATLDDLFSDRPASKASPAEYVQQFVWRDLSTKYDLIGPMWFLSHPSSHHVASCIQEVIEWLDKYEFKTIGIICDGATTNMAAVKCLMKGEELGRFGFRVTNDGEIDSSVPCEFQHPCYTDETIAVVPCATHMLKNLINCLFSSKTDGSRQLELRLTSDDSCTFGWDAVTALFDREMVRQAKGTRRIPKLRKSYVVRDSWTKLNVTPAKIMVEKRVIAELDAFACSTKGTTEERVAARQCAKYLTMCRSLFIGGFLSHKRITSQQSEVIQQIDVGFSFFTLWYGRLCQLAEFDRNLNQKEKKFLSYQTWDLLRLTVFGFKSLVNKYFACQTDGYLIPHKISGSVVETVFSQAKQRTQGQALTGANYAPALKKMKQTKDTEYQKGEEVEYRAVELHLS